VHHPALHPLSLLAQPGRGVPRDPHPPSHPPRILRQRQSTHRRHPRLHRQLQPTLPTIHLDQTADEILPHTTRQPTSDAGH